MSCRRWHARGRASVAAVFLSFLHDEKGPKNLGRHQGPTALGNRPSPMSAVARAPNPVGLWRSRPRCPLLSLPFLTARSAPCRHRGPRPAISYSLGTLFSSLRVIETAAMSCRHWLVRGRASMAAASRDPPFSI